ncbi:PKD domain-containing protein [Actinomadura sp. PM05-2]|uniref:PKD domain-containing protein n=1 Tax=Actinomadura parmotrematis TaxID=2864039 RepID=A0ABS7FMK2_9ACTN|nr:PKD domain-containing protein [Actinomadura parmotrematis]
MNGSIDEAAVYPKALTAAQVAHHYGVGNGTIRPNEAPTAAFTGSCTGLTCTFDASASADSDGTIASYAWDFGDGQTGTGATVAHTYAAGGDRSVKLTVTDNSGATADATRTATPTTPVLATDGFGRTLASGWGTADTGGAWTALGTAGALSTDGAAGLIKMAAPTNGPGAYLGGVSATGTDLTAKLSVDKDGTGNGVYAWAVGRRVGGAGDYRARLRFLPNGRLALQISRTDAASAETAIGAEQTLSGVTYTPGSPVSLRVRVTGTSPTTIRAKAWTGAEPAAWQVTGTDATAGLQVAGNVGVRSYLAGSATNAPVVLAVDDVTVVKADG